LGEGLRLLGEEVGLMNEPRPCAVSGCEGTTTKTYTEPVRIWIVDTHPPEYLHVGLDLCSEHAAKASWSM